jgi:DNA-binding transcriptional regulator YiaG
MTERQKKENLPEPFTSEAFAEWRERMGFTVTDCARELGCAEESVRRWERGESRPPRYIGLACSALALGIVVPPVEGSQ